MSAAEFKSMLVIAASLIPDARPALPSNTKGPASFLGVIGPSDPASRSIIEDGKPLFGLGVRFVLCWGRDLASSGLCEDESDEMGTAFLGRISRGLTVELFVCCGGGEAEVERDDDSAILR